MPGRSRRLALLWQLPAHCFPERIMRYERVAKWLNETLLWNGEGPPRYRRGGDWLPVRVVVSNFSGLGERDLGRARD